jgi:hypothetical protein
MNRSVLKSLDAHGVFERFLARRLERMDAKAQDLLGRIATAKMREASTPPKDGWLQPTPNSAGACCFGDGWHDVEDWGVWGSGDKHEMLLWLPRDGRGDPIELQIDALVMIAGESAKPRVTCFVEGQRIHEHSFSGREEAFAFAIPAELTAGHPEFVAVVFHFAEPICPAKMGGGSSDGRELGLGIKRFRYKYVGPQL